MANKQQRANARLVVAGLAILAACSHYRVGRALPDLDPVLVGSVRGGSEFVVSKAAGAASGHALFVLPSASSSLQLAWDLPGKADLNDGSDLYYLLRTQQTQRGLAYLRVGDNSSDVRSGRIMETHRGVAEVWMRPARRPDVEAPSGIRHDTPVLDWALSPNERAAVFIGYEETRELPPGLISSESAPPRYKIDLWTASEKGGSSQEILGDLSAWPQIVRISDDSVEILLLGDLRAFSTVALPVVMPKSPPPTLAGSIYYFDSEKWGDWRSSSFPVGQSVWLSEDGTALVSHCPGRENKEQVWCAIALPTLKPLYRFQSERRPRAEEAYPLRGGGAILLTRPEPNVDWQVRSFDRTGRETRSLGFKNVSMLRFARELEDGQLALLWRSEYAYTSLDSPTFGWKLEFWNPRTGALRRVVDDLATLPGSGSGSTGLLLTQNGDLVTLVSEGLRTVGRLSARGMGQDCCKPDSKAAPPP